MLHLQADDVDAAIATYTIVDDEGRTLGAYTRFETALFWSLVSERRGDFENAAILAGYADALAKDASLARLAADARIVEASRRVIQESLGAERYAALHRDGADRTWEELPLVRGRHSRGS